MANTPSPKHVFWKVVATGAPAGARSGPRRVRAVTYPTTINPTTRITSGCNANAGKATAGTVALLEDVQRGEDDGEEDDRPDGARDEEAPEDRTVRAQVHVEGHHRHELDQRHREQRCDVEARR